MKFNILVGQSTALDDFALGEADLDLLANVFCDYLGKKEILPSGVVSAKFDLSIVTEKEIKKANKRFRHISRPTDVLSFPLWEHSSWEEVEELWCDLPLGDILICPSIVSAYAIENSVTARQETVLDLCHGFLHLLGYDHLDEDQKALMWLEQDKLLTRFFEHNDE